MIFENVVRHEDHRHRSHHLRDLLLPSNPLLKNREGKRPVVAESQDLAVENCSVREPSSGCGDLGEPVRDQFFTARPQVHATGSPDKLRADAVPLPLNDPVLARTK